MPHAAPPAPPAAGASATTAPAVPTRARSRRDATATRARRAAGTGLQVGAFALRSAAGILDRSGRTLVDGTIPAPEVDWTAGDGFEVALDRAGTAAWAMANVDGPPSVESNCAYFVSDALRLGGGLATTERWQPGTQPGRIRRNHRIARHPAYGCVPDFVIEMQRVGNARLIGVDTMEARPTLAEVGDVIVYNWDGRGRYQHLAVVTSFVDGVMHVTQQTPSQLNRPWNRYGDGRWIATASLLRFATPPGPIAG